MTGDHLGLDGIVDPGAVDRGDRGAGRNVVDADAAAGELERERPGQALHTALADAVAEIVRLRDQLVDARDVDHDTRRLLRHESLDCLAGAEERPAQVDRDHPVEVRAGELLGRVRELDARVVDEDVEATEALRRLADHAHDIVFAGDVALHEDVAHALLPDSAYAGVYLVLGTGRLVGRREVVDRDVRAVLREADGDRLSDSRGAARDQDVLAQQAWDAGAAKLRVDSGRGLHLNKHPARRASRNSVL